MTRSKNALLMILLLLSAGAVQAAQMVEKEGVLHVINGVQPVDGNQVIDLEEVWRHGGEDDEDFFGMISQCILADDGTIYLLDTRMSEIPVYSRDGERLATLSHEGDGPGETRTPSNLLFMPDGTLGIVQVFPGRITTISTDNVPGAVINVGSDPTQGGFLQMFDCVAAGDRLIVTAEKISPESATAQTRENFVAAFDTEGKELARFVTLSYRWDFTDFTWDEEALNRIDFRKVAAGPDGRVYVAGTRDAYRIDVYRPDGTLERVIEREYETLPRDDDEYNQLKTVLETQLGQIPNATIRISKNQPAIAAIHFGHDGNLWVTSSRAGRDQPEGILTTWDLFTPDGEFIRTVSARCEGDGSNDILFWTPGGDAVMVTGFTDASIALQSRGATGNGEDGEEAAPMEVVYLKAK